MSNLCRECLTRIDDDREYCSDCDRTARGDFEKLGFNLLENGIRYLEYTDENHWLILFDKIAKIVSFDEHILITYSMLQAVNKQCEELGWNNE